MNPKESQKLHLSAESVAGVTERLIAGERVVSQAADAAYQAQSREGELPDDVVSLLHRTACSSDELISRVLSASRDCIKVLDLEGKLLSVSTGGKELLGLSCCEPEVETSWADWWQSGSRDAAAKALEEARNGKTRKFEAFGAIANSEPRWWEMTVAPLLGPDGRPERLLSVARDISTRKRNEESLRASEERFRAAFDQAAMGMAITDLHGVFQRVNDAFCRITGYSPDELLGRTSHHITHPEDRARNLAQIEGIHEGDARGNIFEKRYIRKDGQVVWTRVNLSLIRDGQGQPANLIGTVEDITEQKRAQEALIDREQHLRLIFESVTDYAIFTVDPTGLVTSWNPGAERIFGYPASEILGRDGAILWTPEDQQKDAPAHELSTAWAAGYASDERWHQRKDGTRFFASGAVQPMRDEAGALQGFTKVCRDVTRQREAERDLAEARAQITDSLEAERSRLADAFKRSPSFMAVLRGPEHVFELVNDQYYRLVGQRDILGRPAREALPEVEGQGFFKLLDTVYQTGETFVGEGMSVSVQREPDQPLSERIVDFVYQPTRDAAGVVSGIFVHGVDVTERKRAEEASKRLAEQRRLALDSAHMGWWHFDPIAGRIQMDERFKKIFGVSGDHLEYERVLDLVHPEDRAQVEAGVEAALASEDPKPYSVEYRVVHADGSLHWVRANGQANFEGEGAERHAVSFVGTVADITEDKAAQTALRESEALFRQLADAMPQIVWQAAQDGHVDYYNHRWFEYTGMPVGTLGDPSWEPVVHPEDLQRTHDVWAHSLRTGEPYEIQFRFRRASDGEYRWHLGRALPVKDDEGNVLRWFGTNTDIHDQKKLQQRNEELLESERQARAEAERASRTKDEFLATLSHELRTPLNAVLGWAQVLRSEPPDAEDLQQGLATIERNARAQKQIIEDLLDMSRIISGKVRLDVQRVDLASVVQGAVDTVRPAANAKGIHLHAVLDSLAGLISGDPNRLQQVFWNLLSNAVKFTPRDGRIQVLLERVDSHLEVSVIDTGEGISEEFLPYVFDRFRQADASLSRRHGGLGLGLAIVKQLVELHGGTVRVTSKGAGMGSSFIVSLPLTAIQPDPALAMDRHLPESEGSPSMDLNSCLRLKDIKVLVVDDEPDARALVARLLGSCEAIVRIAGSAEEAMQMIQAEKPDVLVSDIGMPQEDGYSMIRRVRALPMERGGNVPAIALTAYARAEDRMKAILAGFQMHVSKPVEGAELLTMVASLAGRTGNSVPR